MLEQYKCKIFNKKKQCPTQKDHIFNTSTLIWLQKKSFLSISRTKLWYNTPYSYEYTVCVQNTLKWPKQDRHSHLTTTVGEHIQFAHFFHSIFPTFIHKLQRLCWGGGGTPTWLQYLPAALNPLSQSDGRGRGRKNKKGLAGPSIYRITPQPSPPPQFIHSLAFFHSSLHWFIHSFIKWSGVSLTQPQQI